MTALSILHCSDLHFGHPAVPAQYEALERMIQERKFDVVAVSGDLSQRARAGEYQRALVFLQRAERVSKVIVVPGNHDVAWWFAPLRIGNPEAMLGKYRRYINENIEPVLRVPGAVFVGLNSAQGILPETLTWNMRDLSIIGHLSATQLQHARMVFAEAPSDALRVVVIHHNLLKGEISQRYGLKHTDRILAEFGAMRVDLVLCGHDHQEQVRAVEEPRHNVVVSTAGTISDRSRGQRPSSVNAIQVSDDAMEVATLAWSAADGTFSAKTTQRFPCASA